MNFNFIKKITSKGIKPGMTAHEEKGVIITNYILLLAIVVAFLRIFLFLFTSDIHHSVLSLISTLLFLFAYYMNTKQYYDFAKFFLMVSGSIAPLLKELMSGGTGNQHFLIIASYGVVFLLFSLKDRVKLIIALLMPTTSIIITVFFPNILSEPIVLSPETIKMEKFFGIMSASVIIVLVIWYFVKQSTEKELKLIESNSLMKEYNDEISQQKSLIEEQYTELEQINNDLIVQKGIIEEQHAELTSSIKYASTIQDAILPWDSNLNKAFREIFVFYKPKAIVSGDSYWFQEVDGIKFLAVIDCTGHGIPGAMLTVIASSVLDDAVLSKKLTTTHEILTFMNDKVTEVLNQRLKENSIRDGMEVALVAIHEDKIQFSGAGRPLFYKNGTFEIVKTDRREIAGKADDDIYKFTSIEIPRTDNITLYLTTDGFADQMNEDGKKYSTKQFINLLESISDKPFHEQNEILETEFNSHKGNREQIDDITILGVKI